VTADRRNLNDESFRFSPVARVRLVRARPTGNVIPPSSRIRGMVDLDVKDDAVQREVSPTCSGPVRPSDAVTRR
jgi:hypothetical protein